MADRIVVVGAGPAGLRAAERLRERGFAGELTIVGEEPYRPYHRPGLLKPLLTGKVRPRDLRLPVLEEIDATWRYNTRASHLEPDEHLLHLPGGEEIRYDGLVIATGAQARHLPGAPRQDPRVHVLRTVTDAVAMQKTMSRSRHPLVVIGGGFVACEIASAARSLGRDATIVVRGKSLLRHVPGDDFSQTVSALHEANGVQVVTSAWVNHWVPQPDGIALHLNTGQVVFAGCVVLAVGSVPAVSWLRGSGLILDDGIMCGPTCHAIGASDVVVAGDAARWPNLRFDTAPRRVEHWLNAVEMGRAAAQNLLAGQETAKPYTPLPRFWSEQHGMRIQGAGTPALAKDTVLLTGPVAVGRRVTGYVTGGNLVGLVGWDTPPAMLKWTHELEKQTTEAMEKRLARRAKPRPRTDAASRMPLASLTPTAPELRVPEELAPPTQAINLTPPTQAINLALPTQAIPGLTPPTQAIPNLTPSTQAIPGFTPPTQAASGFTPPTQAIPDLAPPTRALDLAPPTQAIPSLAPPPQGISPHDPAPPTKAIPLPAKDLSPPSQDLPPGFEELPPAPRPTPTFHELPPAPRP